MNIGLEAGTYPCMLQACRPVLRALTAPRPPLSLRHMGKYSVYAVASGRNPGLYSSWGETESQVRQYSGSQYKGFHSVEAAQAYMESRGAAPSAPEPASSSGYGASYSLGGSSSYARSGSRSSSSSQARSSHEPSYGHDSYQPGRSFSSAPAYDHQAGATLSHSWTEEDDDDSYLPPHSSYSAAPVARAQPQPPPPKSIRLVRPGRISGPLHDPRLWGYLPLDGASVSLECAVHPQWTGIDPENVHDRPPPFHVSPLGPCPPQLLGV